MKGLGRHACTLMEITRINNYCVYTPVRLLRSIIKQKRKGFFDDLNTTADVLPTAWRVRVSSTRSRRLDTSGRRKCNFSHLQHFVTFLEILLKPVFDASHDRA